MKQSKIKNNKILPSISILSLAISILSLGIALYAAAPNNENAAQWETIELVNEARADNRRSIEKIVECYNASSECVLEWDNTKGIVK